MVPLRSVVSPADILTFVEATYDVSPRSCELWFAWWWDEYRVAARKGDLVLRVHRTDDPNSAALQAQAAVVCARAGLDVAFPIQTTAGGHSSTLAYPEGPRGALLFPATDRSTGTLEDFTELGRILALVHDATNGIDAAATARWSPLELAGPDVAWLERLYRDSPSDLGYMLDWRDAALDAVELSVDDDIGFLHGEAYPASFARSQSGALTPTTFEYSGIGSRLYDLGTVRWVLELHKRDEAEETFDAFISAYRRERAMDVPERALRGWVALRHLWAFRLGWVIAAEQGLAGLADRTALERRVRFARHWTLT